jgi:hypothetical protein
MIFLFVCLCPFTPGDAYLYSGLSVNAERIFFKPKPRGVAATVWNNNETAEVVRSVLIYAQPPTVPDLSGVIKAVPTHAVVLMPLWHFHITKKVNPLWVFS